MDLTDLKKGIEGLSDDELLSTLMGIRQNRRARPKPETPKKAKAVVHEATVDVNSMSMNTIRALLAKLEGSK